MTYKILYQYDLLEMLPSVADDGNVVAIMVLCLLQYGLEQEHLPHIGDFLSGKRPLIDAFEDHIYIMRSSRITRVLLAYAVEQARGHRSHIYINNEYPFLLLESYDKSSPDIVHVPYMDDHAEDYIRDTILAGEWRRICSAKVAMDVLYRENKSPRGSTMAINSLDKNIALENIKRIYRQSSLWDYYSDDRWEKDKGKVMQMLEPNTDTRGIESQTYFRGGSGYAVLYRTLVAYTDLFDTYPPC